MKTLFSVLSAAVLANLPFLAAVRAAGPIINPYRFAAAAPSMVDTGLVVRYFINEAASGTTPTQLEDASANNFDLTSINYGAGNMAFTEISGNRGLDSTTTSGDQQIKRAVSDTSDAVRDAMAGTQKATIELVVLIDTVAAAGGNRVFGLAVNASTRTAMAMTTDSDSAWGVELNTNLLRIWNGTEDTRQVIHIVFDTTQATGNDRVKVYIDGSIISPTNNGDPALNETLTLAASTQLVGINRDSGWGNPMNATLFYAALYNHAFTSGEVTTNFNRLTADDD